MVDKISSQPSQFAAVRPKAAAPAAQPTLQADSTRIARATASGSAQVVRTLDGRAYFRTGNADPANDDHAALDRTLDAMVASLKTLTPEQQVKLLADPSFAIEVRGHASNLGSNKHFDNLGLSRKRAAATARYIQSYLHSKGIDIPPTAIKTTACGAPGPAKAADNNDPSDRSVHVIVTLPGLSPLPQTSASTAASTSAAPGAPSGGRGPTDGAKPAGGPGTASHAGAPSRPGPAASAGTALAEFDRLTQPLDGMLSQATASDATLASREATVARAQAALKAASALVTELDADAQPGAEALLNGLDDKTSALAQQASGERATLTQLQAQLKADSDQIHAAAGAKETTTTSWNDNGNPVTVSQAPLHDLAAQLFAKYKDPSAIGKGLPSDASQALSTQIADLMRTLCETVAQHASDDKFDPTDNDYMFGRPGPRFTKDWDTLKSILATTGTPSEAQRTKAISALDDMGKAVKDFDDPVVKQATQSVYDELTTQVSKKLSG